MVDLSKHLQRARQALERRQYDIAIEVCLECQEIDPANLENYQLLVDSAKRRAREGGKKGFSLGFGGFSKDPQKALSASIKKLAKSPDVKSFLACGDAAMAVFDGGLKPLLEVAVLMYEEGRGTGLFNENLLWNLGHAYQKRFNTSKDVSDVEAAIKCMVELERGNPAHPEASRTAKSWEALRSMARRTEKKDGDYRDQLASDAGARRNEVLGRIIRTADDAKEVLAFLEKDLKENPQEKALWQKKGDVHRRAGQFDEAIAAFTKAQEIDEHDFVITMRLSDTRLAKQAAQIKAAEKSGQDVSQAKAAYLDAEIEEYRTRQQRQPTELSHTYNLAMKLFAKGDIDGAAGNFQKALGDPRFKKLSYLYLGHCFAKKKLLDLAVQQYSSCLNMIDDDMGTEAKEVRYSRARVYEALGKTEEASADYTRLVELDLGFKDAATRLAGLKA